MSRHQERSESGKDLSDCARQEGGKNCTKKLFSVLCKETQNWDSKDPLHLRRKIRVIQGSEKKVEEKS